MKLEMHNLMNSNMRRDFDSELLSNIHNPETQYCTVWKYIVQHSEMAVQIRSDIDETPTTKKLFWIFEGVLLYQGPLKWQGADFRLAPDHECMELITRLKPEIKHPEILIDSGFYNLFKFRDRISGFDINIVASSAIKVTNLPNTK
jgi:hypothetical protein